MRKYGWLGKTASVSLCAVLMMLQTSPVNSKADVATVYGDINGDGMVNVMDRVYAKQYYLGVREDLPVTNWRESGGTDDISKYLSDMGSYLLKADNNIFIGENISKFNGIDVSKWQGEIDWKIVSRSGIDFAMIKAGEGVKIEQTFTRNIEGAKAAGVQCGIYWFANARSVEEAKTEAYACLEVIKKYKLEYPVVYDFEYRSIGMEGPTTGQKNPLASDRKAATDAIIAFLDIIQQNGYYPAFYSNKDFPNTYLEINRITDKYDFWYANLSVKEPDVECTMWQYSHTGRVNGIPQIVDLDYCFVDYKSKMISLGLNGY